MRSLFLIFALAAAAHGAVDGTVINRTTNKPQPNATVTLYKLGGAGMESLESVKSDAEGKFHMGQSPQGPHLIQTAYDGVTYNHMLPPGSPTTGLTLEVYQSSAKPGAAKAAQDMVLLEPVENQLFVSENIIFENDGKIAYNDPDEGTLRIYVPEGIQGRPRVMATAPNGMPIERAAEKTNQPNMYKVDFPIKPGQTRFDVSYVLPFSNPGVFAGRSVQRDAPVRLVAPVGVSLKGEGLESLGQEPHTQATIYGVKGQSYEVEVSGTGTLRASREAAEEDAGPSLEQILPPLDRERKFWVLGLAFAILALGFVLMYRKEYTRQSFSPRGNRRG